MDLESEVGIRLLLEASDYRDFLKRSFDCLRDRKRGFTYAGFVRKAGFSSRSFPRDVVLGKKRLTFESATRFANALGLRADLKSYFIFLVARDEPELQLPETGDGEIQESLKKLRKRLLSKFSEIRAEGTPRIYRHKEWLEIYAALGSKESGATLAQVCSRTHLSRSCCRGVLEEMNQAQLVTYDQRTSRYFMRDGHLIFKKLGKDQDFKRWYLQCLEEARTEARQAFQAPESLFFNTVFSISRANLSILKEELRELLLRFVDSAEEPDGDTIARLSLAFYPGR